MSAVLFGLRGGLMPHWRTPSAAAAATAAPAWQRQRCCLAAAPRCSIGAGDVMVDVRVIHGQRRALAGEQAAEADLDLRKALLVVRWGTSRFRAWELGTAIAATELHNLPGSLGGTGCCGV